MKRLMGMLAALLPALALAQAVTRTGDNAIKIPLNASSQRITFVSSGGGGGNPSNRPPPSHTVCIGGTCTYTPAQLANTAISQRVAGDILELQTVTPGAHEVWAARILCNGTSGASDSSRIKLRVRDGDKITLDMATATDVGIDDWTNCAFWTVEGNSTGRDGLEMSDPSWWNTGCASINFPAANPPRYACYQNRRGTRLTNSDNIAFVNMTMHGAGGVGSAYTANTLDINSSYILFKNVNVDLHGTNNYDGTQDQGDLMNIKADHVIGLDSRWGHGGHTQIRAEGPYHVYRRSVFDGSWRDKNTGFSGNHSADFRSGSNDGNQTPYGPILVEDSELVGTGFEPEHANWNQVMELIGVRDIVRQNYFYGNEGAYAFTQCSVSDPPTFVNSYQDARANVYNNTTFGSAIHFGGSEGWPADANTAICELMFVVNNVFMGVTTGTKTNNGVPNAPWAWYEERSNVPLGGYPNSWKGAFIQFNIFAGPSTNMQFRLTGTSSGTVSVTDCVKWPSNVCNNQSVALKFANGTTTPASGKAAMALHPSNSIGLGDARYVAAVTAVGTGAVMTLDRTDSIKDAWGFEAVTWGGLWRERGDCVCVGPTSSSTVNQCVVGQIADVGVNHTTLQMTLVSSVTRAVGSKVWKAQNNDDGSCGGVWKNRGAWQQ